MTIFSCPWTWSSWFSGLWIWGLDTSGPLVLSRWPTFLVLQFAEGRLWDFLASIITWANSYHKFPLIFTYIWYIIDIYFICIYVYIYIYIYICVCVSICVCIYIYPIGSLSLKQSWLIYSLVILDCLGLVIMQFNWQKYGSFVRRLFQQRVTHHAVHIRGS